MSWALADRGRGRRSDDPRKPTQNAFIESLNERLRDKLLKTRRCSLHDMTEFSYQRENPKAIGITKRINSGRDKAGRLSPLLDSALLAAISPKSARAQPSREYASHVNLKFAA